MHSLSSLDLQVQFDSVSYTVDEGNETIITALLNFIADRDVTVDFTATDQSATGNLFTCSRIDVKT